MDISFNKPIPKCILSKIKSIEKKYYSFSSQHRYYSYLTTYKKELVKVTVAAKTHKKTWYCKQVAVHGLNSDLCIVKDMEYSCLGMGYRVGWYNEGLTKHKKYYEDDGWAVAKSKYYNPMSTLINPDYLEKLNEFKYSGYQHLGYNCVINYLKLYKEFPQTEYLLKLGFINLTIVRQLLE